MADYRAIDAISDAIIQNLRDNFRPADFNNHSLVFQVYAAKDFSDPMLTGVSLFLYRIFTNGTQRTPAGRAVPGGRQQHTQLPLDLHFLLTAWAQDASLQHTIAGWMMRIMEDMPVLPPALLNRKYTQPVFHSDEVVTVAPTELTTEELFRIWEVIVNHAYQISVPYVARNVRIESILTQAQGQAIQERTFEFLAPEE